MLYRRKICSCTENYLKGRKQQGQTGVAAFPGASSFFFLTIIREVCKSGEKRSDKLSYNVTSNIKTRANSWWTQHQVYHHLGKIPEVPLVDIQNLLYKTHGQSKRKKEILGTIRKRQKTNRRPSLGRCINPYPKCYVWYQRYL